MQSLRKVNENKIIFRGQKCMLVFGVLNRTCIDLLLENSHFGENWTFGKHVLRTFGVNNQ